MAGPAHIQLLFLIPKPAYMSASGKKGKTVIRLHCCFPPDCTINMTEGIMQP